MFVNCTNHPVSGWLEDQLVASVVYGEIIDMAFPTIDPNTTTAQVIVEAERIVEQIAALNATAVLCQGEATMTYHLVRLLKERGVITLAACTRRYVNEERQNDAIAKTSYFKFVRYREY